MRWRRRRSTSATRRARKVRAFRKLARAEGEGHAERREGPGPTLRLSEDAREAVASWRERDYPVPETGEGPLRPKDLIGEDEEIAPLLEPGGLTWSVARSPLEEEESWLGAH